MPRNTDHVHPCLLTHEQWKCIGNAMVRRCNAIYLEVGKIGGGVKVYITEMDFEKGIIKFAVDVEVGSVRDSSLYEMHINELRYKNIPEVLVSIGGNHDNKT